MASLRRLLEGREALLLVALGASIAISLGLGATTFVDGSFFRYLLDGGKPSILFFMALGVVGVLSLMTYRALHRSRETVDLVNEEPSFVDLKDDRKALEYAVTLAREVSRLVDADEIRQMLQNMLRRWWPPGQWVVLSPKTAEETSTLPDETALKLAITHPGSEEGSGTIIARHLESSASKAIFTLRDVTTLYAVVLAKRDAIDEKMAARVEIFLRVTVSALRSTALLDSLLISEKLAAVGRLSAGVAHEINNPLAFINLNLRILERELQPTNSNLSDTVSDAREGAERIAQIVQGMKLLSHSDDLNVEPLELLTIATRTAKIARARSLRIPIQIEGSGAVWTKGDETKIGQVILDLMTNALDAVQATSNPQVRVFVHGDTNLAMVDVIDNGPRILKDVQARLFMGVSGEGKRSSGLGLRIARSFARAHQGDIVLLRSSDEGSVFQLSLPLSHDQKKTRTLTSFTPKPMVSDRPKILVIDDEVAVVRALKRWLSTIADVDGTSDPKEGLELAKKSAYSLILCDLNMPNLMGTELIETLRLTHPSTAERAVIMTGAIDEQIPNIEVISKPIDIRVVSELIERSLCSSE